MIELKQGDLLSAETEAIVNTVNTVGVMGKGIALQFKKAYPEMFKSYQIACKENKVMPGKMFIYERNVMFGPHYIINFPTKRHWKNPSRIEDIREGLKALAADIKRLGIKSIALPPLGCGHGGLNWNEVYQMIQDELGNLEGVEILVFPPQNAPAPSKMQNRTERPKWTPSRAHVIHMLGKYFDLGYELTLLEIQKLLYFLQVAGEPLKLHFEKGTYGPYADNLRHVLHRFEGHFTSGFGDGSSNKPDTVITVFPEAITSAEEYMKKTEKENDESWARVKQVEELIEGFESPYGLELLSTVHWQCSHSESAAESIEAAVEKVHGWNERKKNMMKPAHIKVAWERIKEKNFLK